MINIVELCIYLQILCLYWLIFVLYMLSPRLKEILRNVLKTKRVSVNHYPCFAKRVLKAKRSVKNLFNNVTCLMIASKNSKSLNNWMAPPLTHFENVSSDWTRWRGTRPLKTTWVRLTWRTQYFSLSSINMIEHGEGLSFS